MVRLFFAIIGLSACLSHAAQNRFDPVYILTNAQPREVRFRLTILPSDELQIECHAIWLNSDRWFVRLAYGARLTNGSIVPGEVVACRDGKSSWHAYFDQGIAVAGINDGSVKRPDVGFGQSVMRRACDGLLAGHGPYMPDEFTQSRGKTISNSANLSSVEIVSKSDDVVESLVKGAYRHRDTVMARFSDGAPKSVLHEYFSTGGWRKSFRLDYDEFRWITTNAPALPDIAKLLSGIAHQREVIYDGRGERQRLSPEGAVLFSEPIDLSDDRGRMLAAIVAKVFASALFLAVVWVLGFQAYAYLMERKQQN